MYYEAEGKRQQSDVLFFKILGQPMVVLNSVAAAVDLLECVLSCHFRTLAEMRNVAHGARMSSESLVVRSLLTASCSNYADRPGFDLLRTLGFRETLTFLRSGPQFQAHRKTLQTYFTKSSVVAYRDIQTSEARGMVKNLLTAPDRFNHYIRRYVFCLCARSRIDGCLQSSNKYRDDGRILTYNHIRRGSLHPNCE